MTAAPHPPGPPGPSSPSGPKSSLRLLDAVLGQETAIATLVRALGAGRVHHAYLFAGPDGVGKETAAFGLAQALVCERRGEGPPNGTPANAACGMCSGCQRAVPRGKADEHGRPTHPDIVVLERGLYEPATIGRRTPETQDLSIDQVRTLVLARAAFPPHEGRAKVFVVRRAEELSVAAANALLKTLEEPNARTHFVLLSAQPEALLSTIRSRTQRVRFAALPEAVVVTLLERSGIEKARAEGIARLASGSAETALHLADDEASAARERFVSEALAALSSPDLGAALDLAEEAKKAKGELPGRLTALAAALGVEATRAAISDERSRAADVASARYRLVLGALRQLDGNASAQLVVETMFIRMRSA